MYTDSTLYRAGALEPVAGYEDALFLVDAAGPLKTKYGTPFFGVQAIRPIAGIGQHGLFLLWTQGNVAPAGYGPLPGGAASGSIPLNGSVQFATPAILNLNSYGFAQVRFTIEIPVALTGGVADDLDLAISFGSANDLGLPASSPGRYNLQDQLGAPADPGTAPAQGANHAAAPESPPSNPWDDANMTEHFWFENNPPTYTIYNNAVAAITTGAIGLRLKGYRYMLSPLDSSTGPWEKRFLAGAWRDAPKGPRRIVAVPLAPPSGTVVF